MCFNDINLTVGFIKFTTMKRLQIRRLKYGKCNESSMPKKKFSERERSAFRKLALEAITQRLATGFNYYPQSIELSLNDAITIPVKCSHRSLEFVTLLEDTVSSEFGRTIRSERHLKIAVYQWLKGYKFPHEEKMRIWDVEQGKYARSEEEYVNASEKLIAEGEELTLVFKPPRKKLIEVVRSITRKGSFYLTDEEGLPLPAPEGSKYPFELNPERISDDAYMTPMIVTTFDRVIARALPDFKQVTKLYKIKSKEEISVYLDKTLEAFKKKCRVRFEGQKMRLANRLFRDFINFEEDPMLTAS